MNAVNSLGKNILLAAMGASMLSQVAFGDVIRFTSDNEGNIVIQGVAEENIDGDSGIEARWANEGRPFEKFTGAFMNFLDRARAAACAFPGLPSKVGFSLGIAQIKWTEKVFCANLPLDPNRLAAVSTRTALPRIEFAVPRSLHGVEEIADPVLRHARMEARGKFAEGVVNFFCKLPLRPEEIIVKIPPAVQLEWSVSLACQKISL